MQSAGHQIIHQIIFICDRVKNAANQTLLVAGRHGFEAEAGRGLRVVNIFMSSFMLMVRKIADGGIKASPNARHHMDGIEVRFAALRPAGGYDGLMPELPKLKPSVAASPLILKGGVSRAYLARPDLRFPFPDGFAEALTDAQLTRFSRRGKYLLGEMQAASRFIGSAIWA